MAQLPPSPPFSLQSSRTSSTSSSTEESPPATNVSSRVRTQIANHNKVEVPILSQCDIDTILQALPSDLPEHVQISIAKERITQGLEEYHNSADAILDRLLKSNAQCFPSLAEEIYQIRRASFETAHVDRLIGLGLPTFWSQLPRHYARRTRKRKANTHQTRGDRCARITRLDNSAPGRRKSARTSAIESLG